MSNFVSKNYSDSSLYCENLNNNNKNISEFVLRANRIDKQSPEFRGIIEDVKRQQNTSILYTVLMMDNVVFCVNNIEMPAAFKVFSAKDIKTNKQQTVFIDVTNLIGFKDNYYFCKKIDILITYLFSALGYLIYDFEPLKLVNNSNVTLSATQCYVSMFTYIIDYLRILGYAQSKTKISYIVGLYFLHFQLGKDIDQYSKNVAAKIAGVSPSSINAYNLYFKDGDLDSLDNLLNLIVDTFKLKGLTKEVFVNKWMYLYGTGTQYGIELFTSFSKILTNAYCGSYVVHQKAIERTCGQDMVKYSLALTKIGVDIFDNRYTMEASELDNLVARDKNTVSLAETVNARKKLPDNAKFEKSDFSSKSECKAKATNLVKYMRSVEWEDKISSKLKDAIVAAVNYAKKWVKGSDNSYEVGSVEAIIKVGASYFNSKDKDRLKSILQENIEIFTDKGRDEVDKDIKKKYTSLVKEFSNCKKLL